ncbi:MAG: hypothetical protein AB9879_06105 [Methanothrix sp.]
MIKKDRQAFLRYPVDQGLAEQEFEAQHSIPGSSPVCSGNCRGDAGDYFEGGSTAKGDRRADMRIQIVKLNLFEAAMKSN